MAKAGEKLIAAMQEAVSVAKGEEPAAVLHWHGHEYVPKASLAACRASALEEAAKAARACFWSQVGGGRIVSRQASPDEVEAAIRSLIPRPADGGEKP